MANDLCRKYPDYKKKMKENGLKLIKEFLHSVTFRKFALCGFSEKDLSAKTNARRKTAHQIYDFARIEQTCC